MQIREACYTDIEQIALLLYKLNKFHQDNLPNDYKSPEEIAEKIDLKNYINNEQKIALVAYEDKEIKKDKVIGFIIGDIWERKSWVLKERRIATIMDVIVDINYQGKGVGKQLYQTFENYAKLLNANEIMVEIYDFNTKAITFYQSCGIKPYIHVGVKKL